MEVPHRWKANEADNSIFELNRAYRQLLMVIGSSPDSLRDYQLDIKTPELS